MKRHAAIVWLVATLALLVTSAVAYAAGSYPSPTVNKTLFYNSANGSTVQAQNQSSTASYSWNYPASAGTIGQMLLSGGGGANPNTWAPYTLPLGSVSTGCFFQATGANVVGCTGITPPSLSTRGGVYQSSDTMGNYVYGVDASGNLLYSNPHLPATSRTIAGSAATTTGSVAAGSTSLTLATASDFLNGEGVRINGAGPTFALGAPTGLTVTPSAVTGSTTYTYTVAPVDAHGGVGPAIATTTITNGNATLSALSFNNNEINWVAPSGTAPTYYAIYGRTSGSMVLIGLSDGPPWYDEGNSPLDLVDWLPTTPPATATNDYLVTSIASGGGTPNLTLAASPLPTNAVTSALVSHDDTVGLQACITGTTGAIASSVILGKTCKLDDGFYPITSELDLPDTYPVTLVGTGRANVEIAAMGYMSAELGKGTTFTRRYRVSGITFNGNMLASYDIWAHNINASSFDNLAAYNAHLTNIRWGDGVVKPPQENTMYSVRMDNPLCDTGATCEPQYNFWNQGTDNHIGPAVLGDNAWDANFYDDPTYAASNTYMSVHGYSWPTDNIPHYTFNIGGFRSSLTNWRSDGALTADVLVNGFSVTVTTGAGQFDTLGGLVAPMNGIQLANGSGGDIVTNNQINSQSASLTAATGVQQLGTAASPSIVCRNYVNNSAGTTSLASYSSNCAN